MTGPLCQRNAYQHCSAAAQGCWAFSSDQRGRARCVTARMAAGSSREEGGVEVLRGEMMTPPRVQTGAGAPAQDVEREVRSNRRVESDCIEPGVPFTDRPGSSVVSIRNPRCSLCADGRGPAEPAVTKIATG